MRKLVDILFNTVLVLAVALVILLVFTGFSMRSFSDADKRPAIYYPNLPDITIMQIDSGVDFNVDDLGIHIPSKYHSVKYMDNHGHGTHVAGIILKDTCLNVKLIPCKFWNGSTDDLDAEKAEVACLNLAYDEGVDIVNFSAGGQTPDKAELDALKKLESKNITVVVAAGNDGVKLTLSDDVDAVDEYLKKCNLYSHCKNQRYYYYPASYTLHNLIRVSNYHNGQPADNSNYADGFVRADGDKIISYGPGGIRERRSGTSQAAGAISNQILREMCNLNK